MYPFQSSPMYPDEVTDGGDQPGDPAWEGGSDGGLDGYVAGDEASSPAQRVRVQELPVGGEEGEDDVEAV